MKRVSRGTIVILTWDQIVWETDFWLIRDYHQHALEADRSRAASIDELTSLLGNVELRTVPIPHDCIDGFHGAFWRRPKAYLDPLVRAGISTYANMSDADEALVVDKLKNDLESGKWHEHYGDLLLREELDLGYRLLVA